MADKEDHPPPPPRGNEWEVVSLTSSAYAASPGPYNVESRDARKFDHAYYGAETSRDLFMSDHFVFPPSQHEDLPIDDDEPVFEEEVSKDDGQDLMMPEEGQGLSDEPNSTSRQYMESAMYEHGFIDSEPNESAEDTVGTEKDAKKARHDLPCEAWWRRRAVSMYIRTREANAMWSLFFAAAVTGLVVLGQRWQQERWQVLQLKWQSSISSEKLSRVLEPLSRLKGVIVQIQRVSLIPFLHPPTMANNGAVRLDLDGKPIKPLTICMIGAGGFIGSHLCEKLLNETPHKVLALDVYNDKIKHLLEPDTSEWAERIQFHRINIKHDSRLEGLVKMADLTINLAAICTPADYNTRPLDTIYSNFIDALPVVKYCSENNKRLIHFSTCEVYGKTIGSFLPKDHPLRQDPDFYVLKEDTSPCIFGSIEKQRWSYACAKQLIERLVYAEGAENGLEFTIVRPFNWIGPRMDFIPGIDGPSEGVPRVLACFSNNLLRREPLKLVDGGESQRTFIYIKDAIEAVLLMIENPERANGHIFNVGNPNNEVTVRQLAEMMTKVYSKVSGETAIESPTIDVSSKEFYGEGYDDSDKRIPDMTIINRQLGWNPKTSLWDLLESTLTYQHRTYAEAVKKATSKPVAS